MAIKLADTARPNNYVDSEHLGTYPVAYAEDVWFEDGTRLSEKTFDGQSIQKEELPLASADELGNIYQYVGETGTYTKGYFYECVSDGKPSPTYSWKAVISAGDSIQKESLPVASEEELGNIYEYIGDTDANYINGYFYKCVSDGGVTPSYSWEKIQVSDGGDTIQVDELPTASADELGNIYEFVGTTTANYINGRFYRCVSDGALTPTYAWEEVDFGDGTPHWSGTRAEYEAIKDTLEAGTYVSITDDYDDGLEVVDVIEDGNMNPVTSNAVADAMAVTTGTGTRNATYAKLDSFTATWTKIGHIVTAEVQFNLSQATLSTEEIITGFPKPVCPVAVVAQGEGNDKAYGLVLKTNGAIRTHYQGVADQFYHATITYITVE